MIRKEIWRSLGSHGFRSCVGGWKHLQVSSHGGVRECVTPQIAYRAVRVDSSGRVLVTRRVNGIERQVRISVGELQAIAFEREETLRRTRIDTIRRIA